MIMHKSKVRDRMRIAWDIALSLVLMPVEKERAPRPTAVHSSHREDTVRFILSVLLAAMIAMPAFADDAPRFQVDAAWPKPLPNDWIPRAWRWTRRIMSGSYNARARSLMTRRR